jgi:hypothetical protein
VKEVRRTATQRGCPFPTLPNPQSRRETEVKTNFRRSATAAVLATIGSFVALEKTAHAQEQQQSPQSAYCEKVRARASSDAALLFAPSVQAQGIKFPNNGTIDSGITTGAGYQFRAMLTVSPLDMYKGVRVKRVGEADCQYHEVVSSAAEVLSQAADMGRLPALEKQVAFFDSKRSDWEAILTKTDERSEAHVLSIRDAAEIRARVAAVRRAHEQRRGEAERMKLHANVAEPFRGSLSALVAKAEKEAMTFENEASHVRSLDAWDFKVSGGVIPHGGPVDVFGMVIIGFNFGAFSRNAAESRYIDARTRELATARYELRAQLTRFREQIKSTSSQTKRELEIVERQLAVLKNDRNIVSQADAANSVQALAIIDLDMILVESERVYLSNLLAELSRLENDNVH